MCLETLIESQISTNVLQSSSFTCVLKWCTLIRGYTCIESDVLPYHCIGGVQLVHSLPLHNGVDKDGGSRASKN